MTSQSSSPVPCAECGNVLGQPRTSPFPVSYVWKGEVYHVGFMAGMTVIEGRSLCWWCVHRRSEV